MAALAILCLLPAIGIVVRQNLATAVLLDRQAYSGAPYNVLLGRLRTAIGHVDHRTRPGEAEGPARRQSSTPRRRSHAEENRADLGGVPFVAMMEPADFGPRDDTTGTGRLDGARLGRVLAEREVRSRPLVVHDARSTRRRCCSLKTITWSRHSRRIDPINLSAYEFCQGLNGLDITSPMPMPATRCRNTSP